jgi:hypothetical protein
MRLKLEGICPLLEVFDMGRSLASIATSSGSRL